MRRSHVCTAKACDAAKTAVPSWIGFHSKVTVSIATHRRRPGRPFAHFFSATQADPIAHWRPGSALPCLKRAFIAGPALGILGENVVSGAGEWPLSGVEAFAQQPRQVGEDLQVPLLGLRSTEHRPHNAARSCGPARNRATFGKWGQSSRRRLPALLCSGAACAGCEPGGATGSRFSGGRGSALVQTTIDLRGLFPDRHDIQSPRLRETLWAGASGSVAGSGRNSIGPVGYAIKNGRRGRVLWRIARVRRAQSAGIAR